jgi:uncharacterized phosphosugar-binding protein
MDRKQLESKLANFKNICIQNNCVEGNDFLDIEESYPGMSPTSFIINVHVTPAWIKGQYEVYALKKLTDLLYENTEEDALENILTLRMWHSKSTNSCSSDECIYYDELQDGKTV